ncbi:hypothetical protein NL676_027788 [Syzygium grande]|nr:hypothetical protein NL676_027788 [Syzygium grande]
MVIGAGSAYIHAHCPREDADALPADINRVERSDSFGRITRARSFMLERDNVTRTAASLIHMRQRLYGEGSCIVQYETGQEFAVAGSTIDGSIAKAALYLQQVLASGGYSHLTKIPICMGFRLEMWWTEEAELAAALQESIDDTDFWAIPATPEAIDALKRMEPDNSPSEGDVMKPCPICLEEMSVIDEKVARMPCRHVFHYNCISQWLNTSHLCPLCRFPMPTDESIGNDAI